MKRIAELDGIRGIAIILILIWHYFTVQVIGPPNSLWGLLIQATQLTWSGVDLFFVLSGFLIGGILIDNRLADNYYKVFYTRRICRIFPLYFSMIAVFIILSAIAPRNLEWLYSNPLPIWSYLTFTQNYLMGINLSFGPAWLGISWSLAIEEQFYLILPFIIRRTSSQRLPLILLSLIMVGPIYRFMIGGFSSYVFSIARTDSLMLGVLLAYLLRKPGFRDFMAARIHFTRMLFVGLIIGAGILTLVDNHIGDGFNHLWLAMLYAVLILLVLVRPHGWFINFFRSRILVWFGSRSYGIYLLHQAVSGIWHGLFSSNPPAITNIGEAGITLLALVTTLLLAEISFRYLESPFLRIGNNIKYT